MPRIDKELEDLLSQLSTEVYTDLHTLSTRGHRPEYIMVGDNYMLLDGFKICDYKVMYSPLLGQSGVFILRALDVRIAISQYAGLQWEAHQREKDIRMELALGKPNADTDSGTGTDKDIPERDRARGDVDGRHGQCSCGDCHCDG